MRYKLAPPITVINLKLPPYYFVYGGYIVSSNTLNHVGLSGNYWSSTTDNASNAYGLVFNASIFLLDDSHRPRYYGFSIRCVAR